MKTIKITQAIMESIEGSVVSEGIRVDFDSESNIETTEHNNNEFWFNKDGLDDSNDDCFMYDATWIGLDDGEDEGSWTYSVKIGDVVELLS